MVCFPSLQLDRDLANEIKHVHSSIVIALDPIYDPSYNALHTYSRSIAVRPKADLVCETLLQGLNRKEEHREKYDALWMALFSWVPIFVDWTKITYSWGSKFVAIVFSFIIHTEDCYFVGTEIRGSHSPRKPRKLVPHAIHSIFRAKLITVQVGVISY